MYNKFIRLLFYILFFAAPLLMNSATSELFEFNKMMFIYAMTITIFAVWAVELIIYRKKFHQSLLFTVAYSLFLVSQTLSTVFSIDQHTSLFGYYGRFNGGLLSIISYVGLFYAFINHFDAKSVHKLLKVSLASSAGVIVWGLSGKLGYDFSCFLFVGQLNNSCWTDQFRPAERMFSTLGQPNWLGAYLAIHFFVGLYFLVRSTIHMHKKSANQRFIQGSLIAYLFLAFASILFTRSRSALAAVFFGLIAVVIWMLALNRRSIGRHMKNPAIIIVSLMLLAVLLFKSGVSQIDKYITLPAKPVSVPTAPAVPAPAAPLVTSGITESLNIRKIVWEGAMELGRRYPILGTGVETFAYSYYFVRPASHNMTSEWDYLYNKAHNEYLNYIATTGYVGFITYSIMIAMVAYLAISSTLRLARSRSEEDILHNTLTIMLSGAYITILITNFFGFSTTTINLFFYLIPGFILIRDHEGELKESRKTAISLSQIGAMVACIAVAAWGLFYLVQYYTADLKYTSADRYSKTGDYQTAAALLDEALKLHYEHVYQDKQSYILANLSYLAAYQKEQDVALKLMSLANFYNQESLKASPENVLYWKTKVKNYYLFYQMTLKLDYISQGLESLRVAKKLAPTDPKIPYSEATFYSLLSDESKSAKEIASLQEQSIAAITESVELKPDYRDAYVLKGQLLAKYKRNDEARQVYEYILKSIAPGDEETKKELEKVK